MCYSSYITSTGNLNINNTSTMGTYSIAIGANAVASNTSSIALGSNNVVIGGQSYISPSSSQSIAIGYGVSAGNFNDPPCQKCCNCCIQHNFGGAITVCYHCYEQAKETSQTTCLFSLLNDLQDQIKTLTKQLEDLGEQVACAPGGSVYKAELAKLEAAGLVQPDNDLELLDDYLKNLKLTSSDEEESTETETNLTETNPTEETETSST